MGHGAGTLAARFAGSDADPGPDVKLAAFASLMIAGLYLDGWAHLTVLEGRLGGFATPWHGVLYAGWVLTGLAVFTAGQRAGDRWRAERLPVGYGAGVVGLLVSAVGAAADIVWHTLFGEEQGVARLLSPPHLALFAGMALMASTPLRAAWVRPGHRPTAPALVSAAGTLAIVLFLTQPMSPLVDWPGSGQSSEPVAALLLALTLGLAGVILRSRWQLAPACLILVLGGPTVALALVG